MFRANITLISCLLLSSSAFAITANQAPSDRHYVIGISAGPTWITGSQTQTISIEPTLTNTYTSHNTNHLFSTGEIFLGMQKGGLPLNQPLLGQLGISVVGSGNAHLGGDIWLDGDPAFNNFNYTYKVNHLHVALKGRVIANYDSLLHPYLSASAGMGVNRAYDFAINANISEAIPPPAFRSNSTTAFTYTVGLGMQTSLTPQLQAALGYEFSDWGKTQFSPAPYQTINQGLTQNHLYAHEVQLSLFYTI
jgi:opacity protein-like surface antigen